MITSSGAVCDVCGDYILPTIGVLAVLADAAGIPYEMVHCFGVSGIEQELHCDNECKKTLLEVGDDWTKLPEGPLKKAFENENRLRKESNG